MTSMAEFHLNMRSGSREVCGGRPKNNVDQVPGVGRQIMDKVQFISEVSPGSHLAEKRSLDCYRHVLVKEVHAKGVKIIHYRSINCSGKVHEDFLLFDEMDFGLGIYLISSNGYPNSQEEREAAIRRACSRLEEGQQLAAINNCEHFMTWALTGTLFSHQIAYTHHACCQDVDRIYTSAGTFVAKKAGKIVAAKCGKAILKRLTKKAVVSPKIAKSALRKAGKAAIVTTVVEVTFLVKDIYDLAQYCNAGKISSSDCQREIITKTSESIGSIAGSAVGTVIGQVVIPVPFVGGLVGGIAGSLAASWVSSTMTSKLK